MSSALTRGYSSELSNDIGTAGSGQPQQVDSISPRIRKLEYVWKLQDFRFLRRLARLEALPARRHAVVSKGFGGDLSGYWHIKLYPGASSEGNEEGQSVRLFLCMDTNRTRSARAEFGFSLLDASGKTIKGTEKRSSTYVEFSAEKPNGDCYGFNVFCTASDLDKYVFQGTLWIKCEVSIFVGLDCGVMDKKLQATMKDSEGGYSTGSMALDIIAYCKNPTCYDTEVICSDGTTNASRFMLSARSQVFQAMLDGSFKEGKSNSVRIPDLDLSTVEELMKFIHSDSCPILDGDKMDVNEVLSLFLAADRYAITSLVNRCVEWSLKVMNADNVLDIMAVANSVEDTPGGSRLLEACRNYLKTLSALEFVERLNLWKAASPDRKLPAKILG